MPSLDGGRPWPSSMQVLSKARHLHRITSTPTPNHIHWPDPHDTESFFYPIHCLLGLALCKTFDLSFSSLNLTLSFPSSSLHWLLNGSVWIPNLFSSPSHSHTLHFLHFDTVIHYRPYMLTLPLEQTSLHSALGREVRSIKPFPSDWMLPSPL